MLLDAAKTTAKLCEQKLKHLAPFKKHPIKCDRISLFGGQTVILFPSYKARANSAKSGADSRPHLIVVGALALTANLRTAQRHYALPGAGKEGLLLLINRPAAKGLH